MRKKPKGMIFSSGLIKYLALEARIVAKRYIVVN